MMITLMRLLMRINTSYHNSSNNHNNINCNINNDARCPRLGTRASTCYVLLVLVTCYVYYTML